MVLRCWGAAVLLLRLKVRGKMLEGRGRRGEPEVDVKVGAKAKAKGQ